MHQEAGARALVQAVAAQVAGHAGELHQQLRGRVVDAGLAHHDLPLEPRLRVVELQRDETLPGALLQVLQHALVAGVVGDRHAELVRRRQQLAVLLHRQHAAVVAQRVDDHRGVLARLDDLVQVADAAGAHRARQRPVHPDRLAAGDQVAPDQVRGGQVVVAGDRDQRPLQPPRHVLHEAGLAAAGRALEQHRQLVVPGRLEHLDLGADRRVVRLLVDGVLLGLEDAGFAHRGISCGTEAALSAGGRGLSNMPHLYHHNCYKYYKRKSMIYLFQVHFHPRESHRELKIDKPACYMGLHMKYGNSNPDISFIRGAVVPAFRKLLYRWPSRTPHNICRKRIPISVSRQRNC